MITDLKKFYNISFIYDLIFGILIISLFFSFFLPNFFALILGILLLLEKKRISLFKNKSFIFFLTVTIFLLVLSVVTGNLITNYSDLSRLFLVLAIMILTSFVTRKRLLENTFLISTGIAVVITLVKLFIHQETHENFTLVTGQIVKDILWLERPYFGIVLAIANFICLKRANDISKRGFDYYIFYFIFIAFSLYISARLGFLLSLILLIIFSIKSVTDKKGNKIYFPIFLAIMISVLLGLSSNLKKRMMVKNNWQTSYNLFVDYEPRFVTWPCSLSILENPHYSILAGFKSYQELETQLVNCYSSTIKNPSKKEYYLLKRFNTHNQFLDFLLVGGIVPFLLLLSVFLVGWFSNVTFEVKVILILFFAFFMVENVLHRQLGCYLFGIFTALYTRKTLNEKN